MRSFKRQGTSYRVPRVGRRSSKDLPSIFRGGLQTPASGHRRYEVLGLYSSQGLILAVLRTPRWGEEDPLQPPTICDCAAGSMAERCLLQYSVPRMLQTTARPSRDQLSRCPGGLWTPASGLRRHECWVWSFSPAGALLVSVSAPELRKDRAWWE
ncbi:hypothetical protein FB451DRAFT_1252626 [Mycena latifolia]|nr:hypothetical protein FB451DRAFT_1252626 [Mycena latifolia]